MPAGLHLHFSNRLERLVEELSRVVRQPTASVLTPEAIVVQSTGMSRWLSQELATRLGVCANIAFPFPQKIVADLFAAALPEVPQGDAFSRELMTWRIMRLLPTLVDDPAFGAVRAYLAGDRTELRRYQLAAQIAQLFDRYLAFRPKMILDWDAGKESGDWQAILWRALSHEVDDAHQPGLARKLAKRLRSKQALPDGMPARLSLFGISTLPPFHLDFLGALADRLEVHLFLMQPTCFLWSHLISARDEAKLRRKDGHPPEALHFERGNSLLTSMGALGRDFLDAVAELDPVTTSEKFDVGDERTALGVIQRDILDTGEPEKKCPAPPDDRSITVASCHSPMREVEALHDALLDWFERDSELRPRDVLVMTPQIEDYAPAIEAVFGTPESPEVEIPFSVADRGPRAASGAIDAFLRLLELAGSRLAAGAVLDVLEAPAVLKRFDLSVADLDTVRTWVAETRIRWGEDAAHRGGFGVPEFAQNSWRAGLDRLLLGYALPGQGSRMFGGVLPFDEIEGGTAEVLGHFVDFAERLFATLRELEKPRPLDGWQELLRTTIDQFLSPDDDTGRELVPLRRALEAMADLQRRSRFGEPVPLDIVRSHLEGALAEMASHGGYLAGRVTFCALKPMRSIPFRVICLLGMNDGAFPRSQPAQEFDRIAKHPRRGDRSVRMDDRYLFLETLLSARDALYLSYVGQSMKDGSKLPPSVVVSELLDYAEGRFDGEAVKRVTHRLQAFSPAYFDGGRLSSFSRENGEAARASVAPRGSVSPFLSEPLAEPTEPEWRSVDLDDFTRFFANPARYFAQKRLGIRMPDETAVLDDREPFVLDPLENYGIKQQVLARMLGGEEAETALPLFEAQGALPPGSAGRVGYRKLAAAAGEVAETVRRELPGAEASQPAAVAADFDGWTLAGSVPVHGGTLLLRYRAAKRKARDLLALWIPLLALNCDGEVSGVLVAEDTVTRFAPVPDARERLAELVALYRRGLCEPLPFFPESSLAFLQAEEKGRPDPLAAAQRQWRSDNEHNRSEADDPFFALAFHAVEEPLDSAWEEATRSILGPLVAAMEEEKA